MVQPSFLWNTLAIAAVTIAGSTTIIRSVPQAIRLLKMKTSDGVSITTWGIAIATSVSWTFWGFIHSNLPEIIINALALCALVLNVIAFVRARINIIPLVSINVVLFAMDIVLNALNPALLSLFAVALAVIFFYPQAWEALRTEDLDGISVRSWYISLIALTGWFIYGAMLGSIPITAPSVLSFPPAIFIIIRASRAQKTRTTVAAIASS